MLHNINLLGFLLITVSFLFGIKLPDWDFKLGLRHRNISLILLNFWLSY